MRCVRISTLRSTCKSLAQTRPLTPASQLPFSVSSISSSRTSSDPLRRNAYCTSTTTIAPCLPSKRPPATKTRLSSSARSTSTWSSTAPKVTPAPNTAGHPSSPSPAGPPTPLPESTHSAPAASSDMNGAPPPASRPKRKSSYKVGEDRPSKLQRSANGSSAAPPAAAGASGPAAEHSDDPMLDDGDQGSDDGWVSDIDDDGYGHDDSMAVGDVGEYGAESNGNISDPNSSRFGSPKLQRRSSKKQVSASLASGPPPVLLATGNAETAEWQETIQRVVRNVVSIRFCMTCSFDTDPALTSEATGFVVDAKRGYILTNRHVVGSGPFWGYCIFDNHEEVDAYPVYRDPVHDFGILKFDPAKIKYMPIEALPLCPDLAKVGVEIRVVGNDAGEKLSILSGVISRLDRNAPEYGDGYSDFNTSYYQASAAASGGSSGSPVVNIDGKAVALQAGGRADGAATDYFLPLDRPLRALRCLQEGNPITRGDIQCQFLLKPFDECRRLGLTPSCEAQMRAAFPSETNMLVAEIVLPQGPSFGKIEEGDVLVKVNGELITQFIRLDDILDSSVGQNVKLELQRGGETVEVNIEVGDLHKITPDRFVTVSGASFHNLSYQQARLYGVACKGVYICESSGSFRFDGADNGWILQSLDHKKVPDLDTFIEVAKTIPDKARVVVTYQHLHDFHTLHTAIIYIDRHWSSKMRLAVRNDVTGLWDFSDLSDPLPAVPAVPRSASFIQMKYMPHPAVADLVRSFVHVNCYMPLKLDGFPRTRKWGMGLVIDAEKGLVVISRAIVPYDLCDLTITIADSIVVEGKVVFLHPLQNYAIVQYDPSLVDAPVMSARLSSEELSQGAPTNFIGYNRISRVVHAATTVTEVFAVAIPANSGAPRYRAVNVDAITVDTNLSGQCGSGVLASDDGTVRALWLTYLGERSASTHRDEEYHLGLATPSLLPVIEQIQRGVVPKLRMLPVEFRAIQMAQARLMGVSEDWIEKVSVANTAQHQLFMVTKRTFERSFDKDNESKGLMEGDILLTLNSKLITRISELDIMYNHEVLDASIVRDCAEIQLSLPTVAADDHETDRAVYFCGAILHRPHHGVRQQISKLFSEVYVSSRTRGSPSFQYGLSPTNFITHVNGKPTPDLDAFLAAVKEIPDNTYFRIKAVTFDSVPWVVTMKKNEHYFPTVEWIKDSNEPCGWRRVTYEGGGKVVEGEPAEGVIVPATGDNGDVEEAMSKEK